MTEQAPEPTTIDTTSLSGEFVINKTDIKAVQLTPPSIISAPGDGGILWAIHPDGRVELGDGYTPDEAAASFWEAVQRLASDPMTREFGAPLKARINAELAAGERAQETLAALAPMFEGLARLIATSSRDWGEYRVDAWLWAVLVGGDCEDDHEHDDLCDNGAAMREMAERHGWDDETVSKARRYRNAIRAVTEHREKA